MTGRIVYSVVFVESSGGVGNCSPAQQSTENWSPERMNHARLEISEGMQFWRTRLNGPTPNDLVFIEDNWGIRSTSCEPINGDVGTIGSPPSVTQKWMADVLTDMGVQATPNTVESSARYFVHSRRTALNADWAFVIYVVDSQNDSDGNFVGGRNAYAALGGPFVVLTWDNGNWGSDRMNLAAAHETGHIFWAQDEYVDSFCLPSVVSGYHAVANSSCNRGGITNDVSMMGEAAETANPIVDVSQSARHAIGWRSPGPGLDGHTLVDVLRAGRADIAGPELVTTIDRNLTYMARGQLLPYPRGNPCNSDGSKCPSPAFIGEVDRIEWSVDAGPRQIASPIDGSYDEPVEDVQFAALNLEVGTHFIRTWLITSYGYQTEPDVSFVTIDADTDGDGIGDQVDPDDDNDSSGTAPIYGACSSGGQLALRFSDCVEVQLGTNYQVSCAATTTPHDEAVDSWPLDTNDDRVANTVDVGAFVGVLGKHPGDAGYTPRLNFNLDNIVNTVDVGYYTNGLNTSCPGGSPQAAASMVAAPEKSSFGVDLKIEVGRPALSSNATGVCTGSRSAVVTTGRVQRGSMADSLIADRNSFDPGALSNLAVRIVSGRGVGQLRLIQDNGDSALNISPPWATVPDTSSSFEILETTPVDISIADVPRFDEASRSGGLVGYGFNVEYDARALAIVGVNPPGSPDLITESNGEPLRFSVVDANWSNGPLADPLPSVNGNLRIDIVDLSTDFESGDGLLARILTVPVSGEDSEITLADPLLFDAGGNEYAAGSTERWKATSSLYRC